MNEWKSLFFSVESNTRRNNQIKILIEILLFDGDVSIMCCCKYVLQSKLSKTINSCHKIKILSPSQQTTRMWASPPLAHLHTWQTHIVTQEDQSQQPHTHRSLLSFHLCWCLRRIRVCSTATRRSGVSCEVPGTVSTAVLDLELTSSFF